MRKILISLLLASALAPAAHAKDGELSRAFRGQAERASQREQSSADRPQRSQSTERAQSSSDADRPARPERQPRAERPMRVEQADQPVRIERADRPAQVDQAEQPVRIERADRPRRFDRDAQPVQQVQPVQQAGQAPSADPVRRDRRDRMSLPEAMRAMGQRARTEGQVVDRDDDRRDGHWRDRNGRNWHWSGDWRRDNRYNWYSYRHRYGSLFRLGRYYDPYGWGYQRFSIGWSLWPSYYGSSFWLNDPWDYRLPPAYGPYRWIRYYDDALLVNIYTGEVVDVIHNFFW